MNTKSRVASIVKANNLESATTGLPAFDLSALHLPTDLDIELPTNLRLGHLVEVIVAGLIKSSSNYQLLYENSQLIVDKRTIGEIDFIIQEENTKQLIHLELAYKFYLFDPQISSVPINNWIGPNRNDSLVEKLEKVKSRQFPLLYHERAKSKFSTIAIDEVSQALCLLVSLFVPFEFKGSLAPDYEQAVKGYYLNFEKFISFNHLGKSYYLPSKTEWGMEPSENEAWTDFAGIAQELDVSIRNKKAPLCWQKDKNAYTAFFIVWW